MKKLLLLAISSLLAVSLTACGGSNETKPTATPSGDGDGTVTSGGVTYPNTKEWVEATSREISTLDYVVTALATNHEVNVNLVDGLLEHDNAGNIVPSLATEWTPNEDSTVWTFKLREGVKWVTNTGEEYADVVAEDFVTGVRHGAEFDSGTAWLLNTMIVGYEDYMKNKDFSDEAWEKVGVKALDDTTLEFTMMTSVPYFPSVTTYAVLYPVNRTFLESKGDGCKFGTPDIAACEFGTVKPDSILYNGAYILSSFTEKSETVLTKNESYWDAAAIEIETIKRIYDDGSDPYSVVKGFEQGSYVSAGLSPAWEDYATYEEKYKDNAYFSMPNSYVFGVIFNVNRQIFEETNHADDETSRANTSKALQNTNFRNAVRYAVDRESYLAVRSPLELAKATLRNVNNIDTAGVLSDGTGYYSLVQDAYKELTGETVDLSDGQTPFYSPEKAMEYVEKAKADGISFPIHLDMLVNETADILVKQANSFKQSIEASTQGNIIIELVLRQEDIVEAIAYENTDPAMTDYDISTFSGWGPDYQDPKSFVDIYSPTIGYYMHAVGLGHGTDDQEVKDLVGFGEYEKLFRDADAISTDMDARYKAYAKADAYLLANALYVPMSQQTRSQAVSFIKPFTRMHSSTGTDQYKYKGARIQSELVTAEEYAAREAEVFGK